MASSRIDAQPARTTGSAWANAAIAAAAVLFALLLAEGIGSSLLALRSARHGLAMREEAHARYDPDLGWSNEPGFHRQDFYGPGAALTINRQGFRALEDFGHEVPKNRYRTIFLGDSFTLGYGVDDLATYPAQIERACPAVQTVDMGQGGYGLDQDYLWYRRDGTAIDADLLVLAPIAHDFFRMIGDTFIGYPKPTLRVVSGKLVAGNTPVPRRWRLRTPLQRAADFFEALSIVRLGRLALGHAPEDSASRFYGLVPQEVFDAAGLALDDLLAISRRRHQSLALVYLPVADLLAHEPTPEVLWMASYAASRGVPFVDLSRDFSAQTPRRLAAFFRPDGHYTAEGNRFVAAGLAKHLGEQIPAFPRCAEKAVER